MPQHPDQVIRGLRRVINGKNSSPSQVLKASKELRDYLRQLESGNQAKPHKQKNLQDLAGWLIEQSKGKTASADKLTKAV